MEPYLAVSSLNFPHPQPFSRLWEKGVLLPVCVFIFLFFELT